MDYYSFDRTKLWLNILGLAICLGMIVYNLHTGTTIIASLSAALLFLYFAINCLFRIYSYFKLERVRKSDTTETEIVRAERRTGLVITLFSNATGILFLLIILIESLVRSPKMDFFTILISVLTLGCIGILIQSIKNLKRFDRS